MIRALFDPSTMLKQGGLSNLTDSAYFPRGHNSLWSDDKGGSETLHETYFKNKSLSSRDHARLTADRESEWAAGKVAEFNFGRNPPGYGDIGRLVNVAKPTGLPPFQPTPTVVPNPFKERLLAIARGGLDSRNIEDLRGVDPRTTMTVEEWVDGYSEWRRR